MGTSSSYGGPKPGTPLLPSWADNPGQGSPLPGEPSSAPAPEAPVIPSAPTVPLVLPVLPQRFRNARNNFSRFSSSRGSDRKSLGRALGSYVRLGTGGSKIAARRMWASQIAAVKLVDVLNDIRSSGADAVLKKISFPQLVGKQPKEILVALTDIICPPETTIDAGIARESFIETIIYLPEIDLNNLTEEQIKIITIQFISRTIVTRIVNDIGHKIDENVSAERANLLMQSLNDFVYGAVKDKISQLLKISSDLTQKEVVLSISNVYEVAYSLIEEEAITHE
jgi:hypothetical protein